MLAVSALIAVYTVARTVRRRTAVIAAALTATALYVVVAYPMNSASDPEGGAVFAWVGTFAAVGGTVRTWRDYTAAMEERALRAEARKEEEARRRVAEERLRIARELHDVVAHHIALITIQAGVAGHFLRDRPDRAEVALAHIREGGRTVLDELGSLLHVLRQSGDEADEAHPTEPVPGLSSLGRLLESLTAAGLSVRHRQAGRPRPLPTAVDLAAYRVIQEALTNAHKHGAGAVAALLVDYRTDALHIEISNPVRTGPVPEAQGTGHGLTGMRERAHAVGGSFRAGAGASGRFRLEVRLPLPEDETPADVPSGSDTSLDATTPRGRPA
ncbi:sensor histidine kinase [Streptomyces himalayensis]|uniref:histidine kinase n=1 Tax=Streptomyces himalayensis subsp. himalayensis TaxID=2756131 RepID=A0A7W0DR18_9ACTN|nr:histidine kinase [Streptomyces himalayensis]MBA2949688.1 two-component sensor histidine kinase [Streptomyces himalayensis subsp. himalayensis]